MNLKSTYNKIANDYFEDHKNDDWWQNCTEKFSSLLKPGSLILDAGCGPGFHSRYLIEKGFKVVGIDFSEKMIEIAKREAPGGEFIVMDIKNLAGLNQKFDGILTQAVFLHFSKNELKNILKILTDKLKPQGYIVVAVKEIKVGQKEEEIKIENDYGYNYERFFSYYTLDEIRKYLNGAGINIYYENILFNGRDRWIEIIGQK